MLSTDSSLIDQIRYLVHKAKERAPDVLVLLQEAYDLGRLILSKRGKYAKQAGSYEPAQLFAMLALKLYRDLTYRETQEEFRSSREKREAIGMRKVPHFTTVQKFFARLPEAVVQKAQRHSACKDPWENPSVLIPVEAFGPLLAQKMQASDDAAADSTGFADTSASRYYTKRTGRERKTFVKVSINGSVSTQKILASVVDRGPCSDHVEFERLIEKTEVVVKINTQLADAGYDSEQNHEFCAAKGIQSIIPGQARRPIRQKMQKEFPQKQYAQRSKATETIFSVIKRKSGGMIRSRREELKDKEADLKTVVYNLHRDIVRVSKVPVHQTN